MKVTLKSADPAGLETPALIVFLFAGDKPGLGRRPELAGLRYLIGPRLKAGDFTADHLAGLTLFPGRKTGPDRVILAGLGSEKEYNPAGLRRAAAKAARTCRDLGLKKAAMLLPPSRPGFEEAEVIAEVVALGFRLGLYDYTELKTGKKAKKKPFQSLALIRIETKGSARIRAALKTAEVTAEAMALVRDMVNRPANFLYPEVMAGEARSLARLTGLKIKVLDMAVARRRGMGAFLGVARGSAHPGRVIILEYKGGAPRARPLALVGKAITFDSGGLSLKNSEGMVTMKTDMAGGAVVLGVMSGAARLGLKVNLLGIVPAAENMPDGMACRPGDVLTSMSGQTIEVTNTDAEGRLVLADALTLAREYKPRAIIDLATLTGACVVALGNKCAGLMGTDQDLVKALQAAGRATGERVWPLPLFDDYFETMKSEVADFKNTGGRYGGAITAGLFLKQFTGDTPWVHLDIAGPARADKAGPDTPAGATGFGVHLLLNYLSQVHK